MSGSLKRLWSDLEDSTYLPRKRIHDALVQLLGFRDQSPPLRSANWPGRLPDDILFNIFSLVIEDFFSQPDALFTSEVVPQLALGRVCRQWRLALRDLRSAWTSIPAGMSPPLVVSSYYHSRGLPLRTGVQFTLPDLCLTGPWSRVRLQNELLSQFDTKFSLPTEILKGKAVDFRSVQELAIEVSSYVLSELGAQMLWRKRTFPNIDTLHLALHASTSELERLPTNLQHLYRRNGHATFYNFSWTRLFPSLRKLRLDGVELSDWSLSLPPGLRQLELTLMSDDQRDVLGIAPANARSLAFLFHDLTSLPSLEKLSVDFDGLSLKTSVQQTDQALLSTLSSLKEVNLTAFSPYPLYLISCANLPTLRRCSMNLRYHNYPSFGATADKLNDVFFNFIRQLASVGVHLRSVYVGHHGCPSSLRSAVSIMASTELLDWTDSSAVRAFYENANLKCTVSWDPDMHASDSTIANAFLSALLCSIPAHVSDTHPIHSLAFSDDGSLCSYFCSETLLMHMPCLHTLVCYGSDEQLVKALRGSRDVQHLKTFVTEGPVELEKTSPPRYDLGISGEPVQVKFVGAEPGRILRDAVMKAM
ncbi:unnamed protein product [Peniophora sp. CBMAI 1063]|nr:unnamed protein product [Peniophora sp. CBMAI 1063]